MKTKHECNLCGKSFDTIQGLGAHQRFSMKGGCARLRVSDINLDPKSVKLPKKFTNGVGKEVNSVDMFRVAWNDLVSRRVEHEIAIKDIDKELVELRDLVMGLTDVLP